MTETFDGVRRSLLLAGGLGLGGSVLETLSAAPVDEGVVAGEKIDFPPIHASTERPDSQPPNPDAPNLRVGFAIMGLGRLALDNILPAFAECKLARPTALVSGNSEKMRTIAAQYGISQSACYSYEDFDRIRDNIAVQAVYIVLPNALHHDAVLRAAKAGKHVLCEKPMATNVKEARAMVDGCAHAGKKLMIAYRCQYELYNRELAKRCRAGEFGDIQLIDTVNTQNQGDPKQWRQKLSLAGGGSLPDVGLYCLNTVRALLGEEPIEITASIHSPADDARFAEVESTVSFTMRFQSGTIANCASSYSAHEYRNLRVLGSSGAAEIENAFSYEGQQLRIQRRDGQAESDTRLSLGRKNQFSLEIDHMAQCIRENAQPRTPGEEGLQDQILMAAIYEAARTGHPVRPAPVTKLDAFRGALPADL